ncbi:hypothetical protein EPD60_08375 [Flaviaesturariibacter flavus]|uniref:Lipoprotein n=1 Tax=Flaviaesturariibacter flavus TaxID=2502780 RepID=A0A4R1BAP4_9BACT|nr:hypothetical protein [Flaviaesturariibacter flavus]TCJ14020.1 hypothetical protein EPD60_08375 [Flaviaesturariibacter flavus]
MTATRRHSFAVVLLSVIAACNAAPPADYTGYYYPADKPAEVDSNEVLRVTRLDDTAYVFSVAGNSGVGKVDDDVVTGELKGMRIGKAPFTFRKGKLGRYEFRAFGSRVELVKLRALP